MTLDLEEKPTQWALGDPAGHLCRSRGVLGPSLQRNSDGLWSCDTGLLVPYSVVLVGVTSAGRPPFTSLLGSCTREVWRAA